MKLAIISDVHANLEALEAVVSHITQQGCDRILCLGDTVGYNANPRECVEALQSLDIPCVMGNHDMYCSNDQPLTGCNPHAARMIEWTRSQLSDSEKQWLKSLSISRVECGVTLVHASLDNPLKWEYIFEASGASRCMEKQTTPVCFIGHTHVPVAFVGDQNIRGRTYSKFTVDPSKKYVVNVGSVGQPRDGDWRPTYVIYDQSSHVIELHRIPYDRDAAQAKLDALRSS